MSGNYLTRVTGYPRAWQGSNAHLFTQSCALRIRRQRPQLPFEVLDLAARAVTIMLFRRFMRFHGPQALEDISR